MITSKTQVKPINGFMLVAGFNLTPKVKPNPEVKVATKAEKEAKTKQNRIRLTNNIKRQKKMVLGVFNGINTTDKAKEVSNMSSLPLLRMYFKRLSDDGYLSKIKALRSREYTYSVTEKGIEFIGGEK